MNAQSANAGGTICVLGGTGFLGSQVVAHLAAAGHRLRLPTRDPARARHLTVLPNARLLWADVHDPDTLARLVAGCDRVINLVGILNEAGYDGSGFRHAHAELTAKLVRACETAGVPKLVQVSALNANVNGPSHYLRSKGQAEAAIASAQSLRWTILQPSVIFGPGDSFLNRFAGLLGQLPLALPLACPNARFAPVHRDDVVAAVALAATASPAGLDVGRVAWAPLVRMTRWDEHAARECIRVIMSFQLALLLTPEPGATTEQTRTYLERRLLPAIGLVRR